MSPEQRDAKRARDRRASAAYRARRRQDAPRKRRARGEEPPHGTSARYEWRQDPCRCQACRDKYAERRRDYRAAVAALRRRAARVHVPSPRCEHEVTVRYPHPIGTVCTACGKHAKEVA